VTFMHAGFAAVGAFGIAAGQHRGWNLLVGLVVSVAVCAVVGLVVGAVSLRFRGLEFAIASIAVSAVLSEFLVTRKFVYANLSNPALSGPNRLGARNVYDLLTI